MEKETTSLKLLLVKSESKGRVYTCGSRALVSVAWAEPHLGTAPQAEAPAIPSVPAHSISALQLPP